MTLCSLVVVVVVAWCLSDGRWICDQKFLSLAPLGKLFTHDFKYIIRLNIRHNIKINCFKPYYCLVDVSATKQ